MRCAITITIAMVLGFTGSTVFGTTYVVRPDGSGDFPTIQAAINAASDGDIIELTDGTFIGDGNRDIDFLGKTLTVRSQSDNPETCIIDCQATQFDQHRGIYIHNATTASSVLRGITITNGCMDWGGAIHCGNSPLTIQHCIFTNNEAPGGGSVAGAVYFDDEGDLLISDCLFSGNDASYGGGVCIHNNDDLAVVTNCTFIGNSDGLGAALCAWGDWGSETVVTDCTFFQSEGFSAIHTPGYGSLVLEGCLISQNDGCEWAVGSSMDAYLTVADCTLAYNRGGVQAGADVDCVIERCLIAFNTEHEAVNCPGSGSVTLTCCDIYGNAGGDWVGCIADQYGINGNISDNPLFWDPDHGDFHIHPDSPCAPAQQPVCGLIGAQGVAYWPDCNGNGVDDQIDIANGTSQDCNENGFPDECDVEWGPSQDCQPNAVPDECDIADGTSEDCQPDGIPDECQLEGNDCNENDIPDDCDIADGTSEDQNGNGIPDECELWEFAKLLASDGAAEDRFGRSVAVCGNIALIGASGDDDNGSRSGSAYVFRFDGSSWVQEAKLLPADGTAMHEFGVSVAVSGETAVIGADLDDDNGNYAGAAYVFRFDGSSWVEQAKLLASDGEEGDEFGTAVSIAGDTILVGTPYHGGPGAVYVFRRDDNGTPGDPSDDTWVEEAKLLPLDGADGDYFGSSVALHGNTAVIGAYGDDDNGSWSGSAYVFRYDGSSWSQEAKLLASDGAPDDHFGEAVAVYGDIVVAGAWGNDDTGSKSGSAYVFRYDGSQWVQEAKLLASDAAGGDYFGLSVAVSGDTALIGACYDDDSGSRSGSAYVFRYARSGWVEEAKLTASDGALEDFFGYAVALDDDTAVIGARNDGNSGSGQYDGCGSAYVFAGLGDCNENGILDIWDIAEGTSEDCQPNGIPDECDIDPNDPDGDGWVSEDANGNGIPDECEVPSICLEPNSLTSECLEGQDAPSQTFEVWNCGFETLVYSISDDVGWLSCDPNTGDSTGEPNTITVNYTTTGLAAGAYAATIEISDPNAANSPQTIPVSLTVVPVPPSICFSPAELTNECEEGQNAPPQTFEVWNCGQGTLAYTIADDAAWLECDPNSGVSMGDPNTITVTYSTAGLECGSYSATIFIDDPNADNSPQEILVDLIVSRLFLIGGQVTTEIEDPLGSGLAGVLITVDGDGGYFETTTVSEPPPAGMWGIPDVPPGTYTVDVERAGFRFVYVPYGVPSGTPPIEIEVNEANEEANQNLWFLATLIGDLDGDCEVDLSDLAILLSNYGVTSGVGYEDGDLDGDGDVDLADLATLLAAYGTSCD